MKVDLLLYEERRYKEGEFKESCLIDTKAV